MTFEEFFTKKRIDLAALGKADPGLFSEFKTHFDQMGERSFDHTKKYWFNKLRRQYHLAPELKPEKVHIPNPLTEQTIAESLSETIEAPKPAPKLGFAPKFKAANMAKPPAVGEKKTEEQPPIEDAAKSAAEPATPASKPGFTPRFRAANPPKPASTEPKDEEKPIVEDSLLPSAGPPKPATKLGFTPKFKTAGPPKPVEAEPKAEEKSAGEKPADSTGTDMPKAVYKPRFNMKNMPPKKEE